MAKSTWHAFNGYPTPTLSRHSLTKLLQLDAFSSRIKIPMLLPYSPHTRLLSLLYVAKPKLVVTKKYLLIIF